VTFAIGVVIGWAWDLSARGQLLASIRGKGLRLGLPCERLFRLKKLAGINVKILLLTGISLSSKAERSVTQHLRSKCLPLRPDGDRRSLGKQSSHACQVETALVRFPVHSSTEQAIAASGTRSCDGLSPLIVSLRRLTTPASQRQDQPASRHWKKSTQMLKHTCIVQRPTLSMHL